MKKIVLIAILSSMLIILSAMPLWDKPVPIRTGDNIEWSRCGALTADGSMIYVWSGTSRGDGDIYAQKVNGNGVVVWDEPLLVDGKSFKQSFPVITRTTDNNFIIAWLDYGEDFKSIIKAQKITANGQILWVDGGVPVRSIPQDKMDFEIMADNNNGAYIAWIDSRESQTKVYGQHLDTYGNSLWALDGIQLSTSTNLIHSFSMATDTSGAMSIAYLDRLQNDYQLYATRVLSNGEFAWSQSTSITASDLVGMDVQMTAINDTAFVVTWIGTTPAYGLQVYAQRINHDGSLGWQNPVPAVSMPINGYVWAYNQQIINTIDNAVIIAWICINDNPDVNNIFLQKIGSDGTILWNPAGVAAAFTDFNQSNPRLTTNNNGGCFVTWEDSRNGGYPNTDIYAQHISMLGDKMWNPSGLAICNASLTQTAPMVRQIGNNVLFGWEDERNGSPSLYYNVISRLGVPQVATDGVCLHQGLAGEENFYDYLSLPRSNDVALLWRDSRRGSLGINIYLQFLNPDGSVDLEANGRPITDLLNNGYNQNQLDAIVTPDDYVAVTWVEDYKVKAQLLDNNGNRLWGNNGLTLTTTDHPYQNNPKISYENGAFYFGWSELVEIQTATDIDIYYRVYGQKIVNNEKQWGPGGILISDSLPNDTAYNAYMEQIKGRYFVWTKHSYDLNSYLRNNSQVKLVNPDGTTAPGWDIAGNLVSSITSSFISQYSPQCVQTSTGLVVAWLGYNDLGTFLYGQLLSEAGALSWNTEGVLIAEVTNNGQYFTLVESNNSLLFFWYERQNPYQFCLKAQKYDLSANPLWSENGILVSDNLPNTQAGNAEAVTFSNGGILVSWWQRIVEPVTFNFQHDICYRYLNPDGSWVSNSPASLVLMSPDSQYNPRLALVNNEAIVTWIDSDLFFEHNRCDEEIWEYYNLFAQKLSNEVVGNIDDVTPIPQIYLKQNYPNPFNPETNISFSLKQTSEIELCIYNLKGQMVKTLQKGLMDKGNHSLVWKGTDDNDKPVASGVYLYRLSSGKAQTSRKMVLLK
jgi:hypothetical protein